MRIVGGQQLKKRMGSAVELRRPAFLGGRPAPTIGPLEVRKAKLPANPLHSQRRVFVRSRAHGLYAST
jgi:hypothetical protein